MPLPPPLRPVSVTPYLACSRLVSCTHPAVRTQAKELTHEYHDEHDQIQMIYRYVRDTIAHSVDAGQNTLVWKPSRIMNAGHALCFGKAHLFVALCRSIGIPAGFCYQRIRCEDNTYVLHGLTAVWLEETEQWVRVDARGNKPGIEAEFNPSGEEKIAYPLGDDPGEWFDPVIYPEPWAGLVSLLNSSPDVETFIGLSAELQPPPSQHHRIEASLVPV